VKLSRRLPLIAALLVSAGLVFAQQGTAFFGDILVLYRQDAGAFPSATNYRGGIVYDTGSNTPWFSNGTTWQPISSGGSSGGGFWEDAGAGSNAIYNVPTTNQVRVGVQTPNAYAGYEPATGVFATSNALIYSDGGLALTTLVDRGTRGLVATNTIPNSTVWFGAGLNVLTTRNSTGVDYAQIFMGARGNSTVTNDDFASITYYDDPGSSYTGLWLGSGRGIAMSPGLTASIPTIPPFLLDSSNRLSLSSNPVTTSRLTVAGLPVNGQAISTTGVTSTFNAIAVETNTNIDFGTGANDYIFSNGTRLIVGNTGIPAGGLNATSFRAVGNGDGSNMMTSATSGNGGIGFRQADNQLYQMSTGKEARPILSGPDWAYDGRVFNVDTTWESTACPVVQDTVISTSGTNVTVSCADVVGGGAAVSPSGFPVRGYRTFNTDTTAGSRSGFSSGTMPASGVGGSPTLFLQRRGGPVMAMWVRTGSTVSNARWYAGMLTAIPAVGLPSIGAQGAYLRFDTSASDTQFRLCTQDGATVNCVNSGTTPAINTEYLFVIDCREVSTACRLYVNGINAVANVSNLPSLTVNMGFVFAIENTGTTAQSWGLGRTTIRTE
jgi:hypothetical protein